MLFECAKSIMVVVDDTWQYVHLTIILWRYDTDGWWSYAVVAFLSSITIVCGFNARFTIYASIGIITSWAHIAKQSS